MAKFSPMDTLPLECCIQVRQFPAVVHPRHARELLTAHDLQALAEWTAGYAITVPEHRLLIEDLLASLAWGETGQAVLVNGAYGTGKSHLLVLLHLLSTLPEAWNPFLDAHPTFRRYAKSIQEHRRLVVHFSLDEYGPQRRVEGAIGEEVARAMVRAGIPEMAGWTSRGPRPDAWAELVEAFTEHGFNGLLLLVDELSLFLAGKSPSRREGDAGFLQFLAGWSARTPVWLIGALQRNLADVGALRTHSWRQVEDRFRRYTLSPQEIGRALHAKLIQRTDPTAIRTLIATRIVPAAETLALEIPAAELQTNWPFHPLAVDLLMAVANGYLSPHRSAVEVLQQLGHPSWLQRQADRLVTPLDLFGLVAADLLRDESLERMWHVVNLLTGWAAKAPDPQLTRQLLDLLSLLHLAERTASVAYLRMLLFDGAYAPSLDDISRALHHLRRYGAFVAVTRDADPGVEVFRLEIDDEVGALASTRMQEMQREFIRDDARVIELALSACTDPAWPLASAVSESIRLTVPWCGAERNVLLSTTPVIARDAVVRLYEGLLARQADGHVLLAWPGGTTAEESWHAATALLDGPATGAFVFWQPRTLHEPEWDLWQEYAAWRRAALEPATSGTPREKRTRQRCLERAEELRSAVEASVQRLYLSGRWLTARGGEGAIAEEATCVACLSTVLAPGFNDLYPLFPTSSAKDIPTRTATQQLLTHFIEPGEIALTPNALLGEYIERFALPLGCAQFDGARVRVTPPRMEILAPLLEMTVAQPLKMTDALLALQCPPLGLTTEQARLALSAAVRTGAVQALDGFLHPLDPETLALAQMDALAFISAPTLADMRHRPLILALATHWQVPLDPWSIACSQVELRLRAWLKNWAPRITCMREALADWSEVLQVLPWGWQHSEGELTVLTCLSGQQQAPLDALLTILHEHGGQLPDVETLWDACSWWRGYRERVALLGLLQTDPALQPTLTHLREQLTQGEQSFPAIPEIGRQLEQALQAHCEAYQRWHAEVYGAEVVAGLRLAFEQADFQVVKLLSRLPLPLPTAAAQCLEALALAKARYCPGALSRLEVEGVCTRCRLPFGSSSPMPSAQAVQGWAADALREYAELLQADPWVGDMRKRLARAPEAIVQSAHPLLAWRAEDGARTLLDILQPPLLHWLCREEQPAGKRCVAQLHERLGGRDLTLAEARTMLLSWLDPDEVMSEETLLAFE